MFMALDEGDLDIVIDAMDERKAVSGETVIVEGENGNELYVVEEGVLECYKQFVIIYNKYIKL
jgi:cAMP-dependent protein kinase regulator